MFEFVNPAAGNKKYYIERLWCNMIYLDNGATTYIKPKSVTKEMNRCMKKYGVNAGRGSYDLALKAGEKMYECREALRIIKSNA